MENISKAVIMAGSVLIAVGVISLALYFYGVLRGYVGGSEQLYSASQVESFNHFYESFSNEITGADMQNITNKAKDDEIPDSMVHGGASFVDVSELLSQHTYSYKYGSDGRVNEIFFDS